jgi:hypothetical protein
VKCSEQAETKRQARIEQSFRLPVLSVKYLLLGIIRGYRLLISPLFPSVCRFQPSCSQYALEAVDRLGAFQGSWLALKRIGRCHPFHPGGYDPVPNRQESDRSGDRAGAAPSIQGDVETEE